MVKEMFIEESLYNSAEGLIPFSLNKIVAHRRVIPTKGFGFFENLVFMENFINLSSCMNERI